MTQKSSNAPPTVLVVDDFDDSRELIAFRLRSDGYSVVEARNGEEAVASARRTCPDLVLMDLSLPVLDGLSATCRMREIEAMSDVPIVACSAHDAVTHGEVARAVGCDAYLAKPLDLAALSTLIGGLLRRTPGDGDGGPGAARRPALDSRGLTADQLLGAIDRLLLAKGGGDGRGGPGGAR